jgi:hypothetical protein
MHVTIDNQCSFGIQYFIYQSGPDIWVLQKRNISPILVLQNFQKVSHNLVYLMLTLGVGDAMVSIIIYL